MEADAGHRVIELGRGVTDQPRLLQDLARRCYPNMAVAVEETPSAWRIRLTPLAPLATIDDTDLARVLANKGLGLGDLMGWHWIRHLGGALWLESINHAWALLAWSQWLCGAAPARPMIVRVAGLDLGVPALACCQDPVVFAGLMEDAVMDLRRPDTVAAAVARGLIGTDSFLTPLLHARPADIVHLVAGPPAEDPEPVRFTVDVATLSGNPPVDHLVLRYDQDGSCLYRRITSPSAIAAYHRSDQPVLLDIDLSYFDALHRRRERPPRAAASASVGEVLRGVSPMAGSIATVTISASVGSCPASRWDGLLDELRLGLEPLLLASSGSP